MLFITVEPKPFGRVRMLHVWKVRGETIKGEPYTPRGLHAGLRGLVGYDTSKLCFDSTTRSNKSRPRRRSNRNNGNPSSKRNSTPPHYVLVLKAKKQPEYSTTCYNRRTQTLWESSDVTCLESKRRNN
jgi:hypothetical protein